MVVGINPSPAIQSVFSSVKKIASLAQLAERQSHIQSRVCNLKVDSSNLPWSIFFLAANFFGALYT